MKILLFHPTLLPPKDYGGVERVVLWLARGLVELGHEVWVGAFRGSLLPPGVKLWEVDPAKASALDLMKSLPPGCEVVHFMAPPEPGAWEGIACAKLLTVHGNGKPGEVFPKNTAFLSADHAKRHGGQAYVYNGIDPSEYRFGSRSGRENFIFLSKTSWKVKNVKGAVDLCGRAGARLEVAGGHRPLGVRLRVAMSSRMKWVGPVGGARKAEFLASGKALVFPILWDEPFGLVMAEALISGTPVLASPRGSVPELVTSEVGALPQSDEEWIEWLSKDRLPWDPEKCRQWAIEKFHYRRMSEGYETLYRRLARGEELHVESPRARG